MDLAELLGADIGVHTVLRGMPITAGLHRDVLSWLEGTTPGMTTAETGCGLSTVVFAAQADHHTCISPISDEHVRVAAWAHAHGLSMSNVEFIADRSDCVLPRLQAPLDLALVDGSHAFPHAFIDFWYLALLLKPEGLLVVDDLQLWTLRTLSDFLNAQPEWEQVRHWGHAAAFRKIRPIEAMGAWTRQPYVAKRSIEFKSGPSDYLRLLRHGYYRWAFLRIRERARRTIGAG